MEGVACSGGHIPYVSFIAVQTVGAVYARSSVGRPRKGHLGMVSATSRYGDNPDKLS